VNATRPSLLKKRRSSNPRYRWSGSFVAETPGLGPPRVTPVHAVSVGAFDTSVPGQRRDGAGAHAASEAVGSERVKVDGVREPGALCKAGILMGAPHPLVLRGPSISLLRL
jgi:hypothetical protein